MTDEPRPAPDRATARSRCRRRGSRCRRRRSTRSRPRAAFELAARLGYDARRGHGRDRPGQPGRRRDQAPVRLPPDPGLRGPRAVPADHPAGLGDRTVGQAEEVRGDGAGARRRHGRRPSAVPVAARLRAGVRRGDRPARGRHRHRLRGREHVPVARVQARAAGLRPGLEPGRPRLRERHPRPLAHARPPAPTRSRWSTSSGPRLRHIHLADGTGSAKDEHLVPGQRHAALRRAARDCSPPVGTTAAWSSRSTPARPRREPPGRPTSPSRWRSPGCTSRPPTRRSSRRARGPGSTTDWSTDCDDRQLSTARWLSLSKPRRGFDQLSHRTSSLDGVAAAAE